RGDFHPLLISGYISGRFVKSGGFSFLLHASKNNPAMFSASGVVTSYRRGRCQLLQFTVMGEKVASLP
ncbi:hypothetical protein FGG01_01270, partial [Xylella fastidiosa subsp. multiplex]|nr:hypothetical protein [Xylella fastidiosa subsp. multiplex]